MYKTQERWIQGNFNVSGVVTIAYCFENSWFSPDIIDGQNGVPLRDFFLLFSSDTICIITTGSTLTVTCCITNKPWWSVVGRLTARWFLCNRQVHLVVKMLCDLVADVALTMFPGSLYLVWELIHNFVCSSRCTRLRCRDAGLIKHYGSWRSLDAQKHGMGTAVRATSGANIAKCRTYSTLGWNSVSIIACIFHHRQGIRCVLTGGFDAHTPNDMTSINSQSCKYERRLHEILISIACHICRVSAVA